MREAKHVSTPVDPAMSDTRGFALLAALTASEVWATASPDQARGFYLAIGRRLAALEPIEQVADLSILGDRLNRLWGAFEWGQVRLHMDDDGIIIRHEGLPHALDGDVEGLWPELVSAVLEGAYDSWFRTLGSGDALQTRRIDQGCGTLELWHGR